MRWHWAARVSALVAVACLGAGCADPGLGAEADELRAEIAALPGVSSALLDYGEPVPLSSGSLTVQVEMEDAATTDEVVTVAQTAYDAFSDTHHGEEADLSIRAGQDTVALRSFEPEASTTAVVEAVRTGLTAVPGSGSVAIDLTTDDVPDGDQVAGTYLVSLPERSTYADVPDLLAALAGQHPDSAQIGWGAAAADGASLGYDSGFPPADLVSRWQRIQTVGLPLAVRAFEDGALITEGRLDSRPDVEDAAQRRGLDSITHAQVRALGDGEWVYTVRGPGGAYLTEIDRYTCVSASEGPYDDGLEAWVTEELGPCDDV